MPNIPFTAFGHRSLALTGMACLAMLVAIPIRDAGGERAALSSPIPQDDPYYRSQTAWKVSYVVRPVLDEDALDITTVLLGDISGGVVWRQAPQAVRRADQSRPEAQDGFGQPLRVTSHPQGWTVTGASGGGMRLSYRVKAPGSEPVGTDGVGITSESVYAAGHELFLVPDPRLTVGTGPMAGGAGVPVPVTVEVVFDIPISWRIVVPWEGFGRTYRPSDTQELWASIVAIGDYRRHSVRTAGIELTVGIQGSQPSRDASVIEAMRRVLAAGQHAFGSLPSTTLTVVLPRHASGGRPSVRLGSSVGIAWNWRGGLPGDVEDLHRMAGELLRVWHGPDLDGPMWYVQGATDYLAWLVLLRQNLIQRDTFRQQILMAERTYLAHPHALDWSFMQEEARTLDRSPGLPVTGGGAGESGPEIPPADEPGSLARSRGLLVSLCLDATLARLTAGQRRLTDLMRTVHEWQGRTGTGRLALDDADLMASCAVLTGGDYLDSFFQALVQGTQRPPTAEALGDIVERERER